MPTRTDPREGPIAADPAEAVRRLPVGRLRYSRFSLDLYGDPDAELELDGLLDSLKDRGVLVPLVVTPTDDDDHWEVVSGHRRLAGARRLGLVEVPCQVRDVPRGPARRLAILEYNRQRRKTFSQMMREADALAEAWTEQARRRQQAALRRSQWAPDDTPSAGPVPVRRDSDGPGTPGRTDQAIGRLIGIGGKDTYRQARAIWDLARLGDPRAIAGVAGLDARVKTVHAAYKDLRRRDRFASGFRPTPYDVWAFRHDPAFGVPHPGAIPPAIVAHTLHYFTDPGALVVDPMAGGGTTPDVCRAMGRRCLAYDINPVRSDVRPWDVNDGMPEEASGCDLLFYDPPYHTMKAGKWGFPGAGDLNLASWGSFLAKLSTLAYASLRPGGHVALLVANQTEKDLPAGHGYLDHAFLGYQALIAAGFLPRRRISCPMQGAYLPQQVRRAREDGRLLGQVRDLLIMRKPTEIP